MKKLCLPLLLLASKAFAQDPHAGHHQHETHEAPQAEPTDEDGELRDPHAYSNGYTSHSGPYHDPDMPTHLHGTDDLFFTVLFDRLEQVSSQEEKPETAWEVHSWIGSSFEKLWLKSEGEYVDKKILKTENELFWSHAIHPYWDSILGVRYDAGEFPGKAYAALGVHGLAPYWFETSATFFMGDKGRFGFNAEFEYELLFTQKLILAPRFELDLVDIAKKEEDPNQHPSEARFGLRLRYEIYRRLAPYIGLEQSQLFRTKETHLASEDDDKSRTDWLAGLKFWF